MPSNTSAEYVLVFAGNTHHANAFPFAFPVNLCIFPSSIGPSKNVHSTVSSVSSTIFWRKLEKEFALPPRPCNAHTLLFFVLVIFLFSFVVSFEFIVIAEREATRPVAATRMYERERERERERESCVFWRLFAFTQKGKRKMSTVFESSVKREKKDKKRKNDNL
jgi:hypothetical protein